MYFLFLTVYFASVANLEEKPAQMAEARSEGDGGQQDG